MLVVSWFSVQLSPGDFRFGSDCTFQFMGLVFYFLKSFQSLGLVVRVSIGIGVVLG